MEYAKRLVCEWHTVTWFASWFDGALTEESIDGINIIRKFSINSIYFLAWKWYKEFNQNNTIDIIIDEAGWIPLLSPLYEKNIPIYFFIHHIGEKEYDDFMFFPFNTLLKKFVFWSFNQYKHLPTITVSNSTKQELEEKFNFKNVHVIENATDIVPIKTIDFTSKRDEIVFLGRLTPMKRVDHAILAFEIFHKSHPSYHLNIIWGKQDIEYFKKLEELITNKNLQQFVHFHSYSPENVQKYLTRAKVMLVPSTKEGFGLIVLEWNACWLPVIGYDVPGIRDSIKDWVNGYLIEDNNYSKIAEKISNMLSDDNEYKKISDSSLTYIQNLGWWDERYKEFKNIIKI